MNLDENFALKQLIFFNFQIFGETFFPSLSLLQSNVKSNFQVQRWFCSLSLKHFCIYLFKNTQKNSHTHFTNFTIYLMSQST